ncbi:ATP-dependent DNA helicase [Nephila pilipes]|uniref:ATP-dependent DNA helicase n=1 Tax=Nephila pilipes TaxID=299642 RepID=A0A8X6P3N8_NEPPI|nr:ATP-dependent DNA helicase [Nephila pilipes]
MGRPKLSPEEALQRKRESIRKSKQRPEAKERHRELERIRRAKKRAEREATRPRSNKNDRREKLREAKRKARADPVKRAHEELLRRKRRRRLAGLTDDVDKNPRLDTFASSIERLWDKTVSNYLMAISDGPDQRCICCDGLWFKESISSHSKLAFQDKKISADVIERIFPSDIDEGQFCSTCMSCILMDKVPPLAVSNRFKCPDQPTCLSAVND